MALGQPANVPGSSPVPVIHQFNGRKKAAFLLALAKTGSIRGAAARVGVNVSTVYKHAQNDQMFGDAIERARGDWEQAQLERIDLAANTGKVIERNNGTTITEPGDWHAASWLLEHAPFTRERYAGILKQKVEIGGDPDGAPIQTQATETIQIEIGPDMMERLASVVQVLINAGKLRLPDPGEIIEGTSEEV